MLRTPTYKREDYDYSCPSGGQWYSCGYGSLFVGCCDSEACTSGCSAGDLRAGSFRKSEYGQIAGLLCPGKSQFYTCQNSDPPFWGCCKSNPCNDGCPQPDLAGASLEQNNPQETIAYAPTGGSSAGTSWTATSSTPTTQTTGAVSMAVSASSLIFNTSSTPTPSAGLITSHASSPSAGAITGGVVGGVLGLFIVVSLLLYYCRHASTSSRIQSADTQTRTSILDVVRRGKDAMVEQSGPMYSPNPSLPRYSSPTPAYTSYYEYDHYNSVAGAFHELRADTIAPSPTHSVLARGSLARQELSAEVIQRAELESPQDSTDLGQTRDNSQNRFSDRSGKGNLAMHQWPTLPVPAEMHEYGKIEKAGLGDGLHPGS